MPAPGGVADDVDDVTVHDGGAGGGGEGGAGERFLRQPVRGGGDEPAGERAAIDQGAGADPADCGGGGGAGDGNAGGIPRDGQAADAELGEAQSAAGAGAVVCGAELHADVDEPGE